eukprot:4079574-Prymnesium_polylepis.1
MLPSAAADVAPPTQAHGAARIASRDAKHQAPRRAHSRPVPTSPAHAPAAGTADSHAPPSPAMQPPPPTA